MNNFELNYELLKNQYYDKKQIKIDSRNVSDEYKLKLDENE